MNEPPAKAEAGDARKSSRARTAIPRLFRVVSVVSLVTVGALVATEIVHLFALKCAQINANDTGIVNVNADYIWSRITRVAIIYIRCSEFLTIAYQGPIVAISTVVVALFTGTLYWVTRGMLQVGRQQQVDLQRSIRAAEESAAAATRQANVSEQALANLERPYILLSPTPWVVTIMNRSAGGPEVAFGVRNYGRTPALLDHLSFRVTTEPRVMIWPQLIGYARAKQYLLTGDLLTGAEAATIGLINIAARHVRLGPAGGVRRCGAADGGDLRPAAGRGLGRHTPAARGHAGAHR